MKLKTSFFNPTVLKKDITRFAPVWGLYTIVLVLFVLLFPDKTGSYFPSIVSQITNSMSPLNFAYAGLCAALLFGDLFNPRLCNALHALPVRREGLFLTHCISGLLFCLVPNLVAACLAAAFLKEFAFTAFLWLAVMVLQFLFFFGLGTISALCAGNWLGMVALYLIGNFLSYILAVLLWSLFVPLLYGLEFDIEVFTKYCPLVQMAEHNYMNIYHDYMRDICQWKGFGQDIWLYTFLVAGLGLIFLGLSVLVYRKRHLETAGDFISVKWLQPVFLAIYTLGVGVVLYELAESVDAAFSYLFLIIGLVLGFFTGRMLLERKVNVFRPKAFAQLGIFVAVLALLMGLTRLDPAGVTRYVPQMHKVQSVTLSDSYSSRHYATNTDYEITDAQQIQMVTQIHETLIAERCDEEENMVVYLHYKLKNGTTVKRCYRVSSDSAIAGKLEQFFSSWQYVFGTDDWTWVTEHIRGVVVDNYAGDRSLVIGTPEILTNYNDEHYTKLVLDETAVSLVSGLLEAIRADCDAGTFAQNWEYHDSNEQLGWINLIFSEGYTETYYDLRYYSTSENTAAYLSALLAQTDS